MVVSPKFPPFTLKPFGHSTIHISWQNYREKCWEGWVNDSTPEGEFQETVNKSMAMRKAVAMAESFGKA